MSIPAVELEIVYLPVAKLHPNPWNPNRQREAVRRAQRESLERYGVIQPVTVRDHPDIDGEYEIVNGEHRWVDAQDYGLETLPAIVLEADDGDARKLTVVLNETAGDPDAALLGSMLLEIKAMQGDGFPHALPYSSAEIDGLLSIGGELPHGGAPAAAPAREPNPERQTVLAYSHDRHQQFHDFLMVLKKEWGTPAVSEIVFEAVRRAALAASQG